MNSEIRIRMIGWPKPSRILITAEGEFAGPSIPKPRYCKMPSETAIASAARSMRRRFVTTRARGMQTTTMRIH